MISASLFQKEYLVEKWDWDLKWARLGFMAPGPGLLDYIIHFAFYAKTYGQIGIKLYTYTSSQNSLSQWGCIIHCILSVRCMRSKSRMMMLFDVCKVLYFPLLKAYLQHNKTPWHQTLSWSQKNSLHIWSASSVLCACAAWEFFKDLATNFRIILQCICIFHCVNQTSDMEKDEYLFFHTALSFGGQIDQSTLYILSFVPLAAIFRE